MYRLLLLLSFCALTTSAQQANHWYFGVLAGVQFNNGIVTAVGNGALNTNEGCATVSNTTGALQFYTDGITVWDKGHQPMPNGTGLLGGISSTQSALIVPDPGNTSQYYLFTTDEIGGPNGFRYSIVNMTLQSGMGDVDSLQKNILLLGNVTEKLTGVQHANGIDYWVTVHEWGTNAFYSYQVTAAGIQAPVISSTGGVHSNAMIQNTYGQMKFSPCGNKLALTIGYQDEAELFDFDAQTGVVSNPITLSFIDHVYGVEFSQDQQKLYVSCYDPLATLVQFDLTSGNSQLIAASATTISTLPDIYGLQIGPDGKIYVSRSWSPFLGSIDFPSLSGAACNYNDQAINLDPNAMGITCAIGLPGFVQSIFKTEMGCLSTGVEESDTPNDYRIITDQSGSVTIWFDENRPKELEVLDLSGRRILTEVNVNESVTFGKGLSNGVYMVLIHWEKGLSVERILR